MRYRLGENSYGKAETRLLRVTRHADRDQIKDLNVSVSLSGDFDAAHYEGDNAHILPTDSQKNTIFAFAREAAIGEIEDFGLRLARHFVRSAGPVRRARVEIEEYPWAPITVGGEPDPHAFMRTTRERRTASVTWDEAGTAEVTSGLADAVVLKSAGSEFWGFARDRFTTLEETRDRLLATAINARWQHSTVDVAWAQSFSGARQALLEAFAQHYSLSLQQTLYEMGKAVLQARQEIAEVRLQLPNKHHYAVDLTPFGLSNENEVFYAADRPYGLIEATVRRELPSSGD